MYLQIISVLGGRKLYFLHDKHLISYLTILYEQDISGDFFIYTLFSSLKTTDALPVAFTNLNRLNYHFTFTDKTDCKF